MKMEDILAALNKVLAPQLKSINDRLEQTDKLLTSIDAINNRMSTLEAGAKDKTGELDEALREVTNLRDRLRRHVRINDLDHGDLAGIDPAALARVDGPVKFDARGRLIPNVSTGLVEWFRDAIAKNVDGYDRFLKNVLKREMNELSMFEMPGAQRDTSQLNSGAGTVGGFVIPPQYRPELQKLLTAYGQARKLFRVIPMETDTLTMPALDAEMTVYEVNENAAPTESFPTFQLFTLKTSIFGQLTHIPLKLIMQSNPAIVQIVIEAIFRAFAKYEDQLGFTAKKASGAVYGAIDTSGFIVPVNGLLWTPSSGNTNSRGNANIVILGNAANSGKTHTSDITFDDCRRMINATPTPALDGAAYFMHRTVLSQLIGLAQATAASNYVPLIVRPDGTYTLYGFPIIVIEAMPVLRTNADVTTPFVAFCNPTFIGMGDMQNPSVAQDSSIGFKNGQIWVRGFEMFGFEATVKDAITILQTSTT